MPGRARARRYRLISGVWLVSRFGQMPGNTQEGLRQAASICRDLQASRYLLAVGPPRSETTPVKPGTLSRTVSISVMMEFSDRVGMMRASGSVGEQKVQAPKQPRWMAMEKRIIS